MLINLILGLYGSTRGGKWTHEDILFSLFAILIFVFLGKIIHAYINRASKPYKKPNFIIPVFASITIALTIIICSIYLPHTIKNKQSRVEQVEEEAKPEIVFNSDTLDKYYLDLKAHDSLLTRGLKNISENDLYSYINYYQDRLNLYTEQNYIDVANWAMGIVRYYTNQDKCLYYFNKVKNKNLYKCHFYVGHYYLNQDNYAMAEPYIAFEYQLETNHNRYLIDTYFDLLIKNRNFVQARKIYKAHEDLIQYRLKHDFYIYDFRFYQYIKDEIKYFVTSIKIIDMSIAFLITFTWFYFLYFSDLFQKEKFRYVFFVVALQAFLVFSCPFIYNVLKYHFGWTMTHNSSVWDKFVYSVACIGFVEETIKAIPLFMLMLLFKEPDDSYDYLFYICISSLTFSFIENSIYFDSSKQFGVYNGRALFSTIGHLYDSSLVAYGFMYAKFNKNAKYKGVIILLFCCLGILSHGLYDFFIFANLTPLFYLGYFMSIVIWVLLLNNSLNNSKYFSYKFENRYKSIQLMIGVNLTLVLLIEYVLNAINNGVAPQW